MAEQWESSDYVARGMSTRPVRIDGTDYITRVTREALEGMAAQVAERFIPIMVEHLDYVPPIGRWHSAEVVEASDGEHELEMRGKSLRQLVPVGTDPVDVLRGVDDLPEVNAPAATAHLRVETRNFSSDDIAVIRKDSPFPIEEEERWSSLPPLIWSLSIPVVWGACKFAGSFFETLGKESAESFARWIRDAWNRSKEPDRDRMLCLQFELSDGGLVYGFIPSASDGTDAEELLLPGLVQANAVASFAGLQEERAVLPGMKRAAFIFQDGRWNLAWWTDGEAVYRTNWFDRNMPDPVRFLGRPLMSDRPSAKSEQDSEEPT